MSIEIFKQIVERAAASEGIAPVAVTRKIFRKYSAGILSGCALEELGGFVVCMETAFPRAPIPSWVFADGGARTSEFISELILQCANEQKTIPQRITWNQFATFLHWRYGENSKGLKKYVVTRIGGYNAIRDSYYPPVALELEVDRERMRQHAILNRKLGKQQSEYQFVLDRIREYSETAFPDMQITVNCQCPRIKKAKTARIFNLTISDLHIGSDVLFEETGVTRFGYIEETRRMASIAQQVVDYKRDYRDQTEIEILLLGDLIQNQLHDARDGAVLADQVVRCMHILSHFIAYIAAHYKAVRVRCVPGNHGRFTSRHKQRATYQKWDSIETIIYWHLKSVLASMPNVEFFLPKTPYLTYQTFDFHVFATHGDTVLKAGNPSKSVSITEFERQSNRINSSRHNRSAPPFGVFASGHVHSGNVAWPMNRTRFLTNAPLIPPDDYCISLGLFEAQCGQLMWESTPTRAVTDLILHEVDDRDDVNESLDSIILPLPGLCA